MKDQLLEILNPVVVHGRPYQVRLHDNVDCHGTVELNKRIIEIDSESLDDFEFLFCPALVHELVHAGLKESGLSLVIDDSHEEAIAHSMEMALGGLIHTLLRIALQKANKDTSVSKRKR